jgi:hypothetical protein
MELVTRSQFCVCVCVCVCICVFEHPHPISLRMVEPIYIKLRIYYAYGSWAHFNGVLHNSLPSVCMSVRVMSPDFATQHFPALTKNCWKLFSMWLLSFQRRVPNSSSQNFLFNNKSLLHIQYIYKSKKWKSEPWGEWRIRGKEGVW